MEFNQSATMHDGIEDPKIAENKQWLFEQKAKMLKYCRTKQLDADRLLDQHYAGLAPYFALWGVENRKEHKKYWVITGDLPNDHMSFDGADNPRDALRHFSMSWQLKAENMEARMNNNEPLAGTVEQHKEMISLLRDRAENLYEIVSADALWQR